MSSSLGMKDLDVLVFQSIDDVSDVDVRMFHASL